MSAASHGRHELASPNEFVAGLDSLRLFAAAMVAVCHLARNLPSPPPSLAEDLFFHQLALLANGQAAVGLFFVISGFCIHYRQAARLRVDTGPFLAARTIRVGVPLLAISAVAACWGTWATAALQSVLWSLYCELAYYLTYPILLACRRRWRMSNILVVAIIVSAGLVLLQPRRDFLQDYGIATALVCYPLWLAGCLLAERNQLVAPKSGNSIFLWRLAALALCWLFPFGPYGPFEVSAAVKVALVGVFSTAYLPIELARWKTSAPPIWSEALGRCSYSLYLVHILPIALFTRLPTGMTFWPVIALELAAVTACTFAAYWLCEAPAHRLARTVGKRQTVAAAA